MDSSYAYQSNEDLDETRGFAIIALAVDITTMHNIFFFSKKYSRDSN